MTQARTTFDDPDLHYLVRVYPDGSAKHSVRRGDQSGWVDYNLRCRPGNALFVDGRCVALSFLTSPDAEWMEAGIRREMAVGVPLDEDRRGPQEDRWGLSELSVDRYVGYRPERSRAPIGRPPPSRELGCAARCV